MVSGVLSASRTPDHWMSRYAVIDFNSSASLRLKARFSDAPQFVSWLDSGSVPLLEYGPRPCRSLAQRGSAIMGTGPDVGNTTPGQPASWLATRGKVAASLIDANTSGLPFSSDLV